MKKILLTLASSALVLVSGTGSLFAQEDEGNGAAAVELYACSFAEGKGPADLEAVNAKWNKWADDHEVTDYAAWGLTPYFYSPNQEFDMLWIGVTPNGTSMGAAQDAWIADGGELQAEFDNVAPCASHTLYAALQFKAPPERDGPSRVFLSFSNCSIGEGKDFADVAPALTAWSEFRASQDSTAGMWALFPVYGGGGEEFDFKWVTGYGSLEEQGNDFDSYDPDKAQEIFPMGLLSCDSSRVYIADSIRTMQSDE